VTSLILNRLGEREAAAIIAHIVGNEGLPPDVMIEIVERTDGIPLFVEEMTKAVPVGLAPNWRVPPSHGAHPKPTSLTLYDHVLDMSVMVGAIPPAYGWTGGSVPVETCSGAHCTRPTR